MSIAHNGINSISLPVIAGVEITTDVEGRFNLNALHKASGGEKKNGPSYWLALETTQSLINELESKLSDTGISVSVIRSVKGGLSQGSYAHELLAIAYASWISPSFHLQVNQVFLDYRTVKFNKPVAVIPDFADPVAAARAWADEVEQKRIAQYTAEEAIRTKAQIGSKREATAMATAAAQTKRANQLADLLGEGRNYATIKAVERVTGETYSPYPLRKYCKKYDLIPNDAPDKTYGTVKAWPAQAWLSVYDINIKSVFGLKSVVGGVA